MHRISFIKYDPIMFYFTVKKILSFTIIQIILQITLSPD